MADMKLFDHTVGVLEKVLDLRQKNQQLITGNIANAETPNYRPARLEFEQNLQQALGTARRVPMGQRDAVVKSAVQQVQGQIRREDPGPAIGDGNGVSLDQEMALMAENQLKYEAAVRMMNKKMSLLKYVVGGGR